VLFFGAYRSVMVPSPFQLRSTGFDRVGGVDGEAEVFHVRTHLQCSTPSAISSPALVPTMPCEDAACFGIEQHFGGAFFAGDGQRAPEAAQGKLAFS